MRDFHFTLLYLLLECFSSYVSLFRYDLTTSFVFLLEKYIPLQVDRCTAIPKVIECLSMPAIVSFELAYCPFVVIFMIIFFRGYLVL